MVRGALLTLIFASSLFGATPPQPGDKAPDFTLQSTEGKAVRLSEAGPTVLVVLRGFPGYQCPFCQRQVREFVKESAAFEAKKVRVVFVYPGPADKARESIADASFPASMHMLVDPDYAMTNLYGLRWDAKGETAYPSTFLIDSKGVVYFAKVSKAHGGRTSPSDILPLLRQ